MKRFLAFLMPAAIISLLCSCEHKELDYLCIVDVQYDWSKASGAKADWMSFYADNSVSDAQYYKISGGKGQSIRFDAGDYDILTFNKDIDGVTLEGENAVNSLTLVAEEITELPNTGGKVSDIDKVNGAESELFIKPCGEIWYDKVKSLNLETTDPLCDLVLTPEKMTSTVTVNAPMMDNLTKIDAILTGMNGKYVPFLDSAAGEPCTVVFDFGSLSGKTSLTSTFSTFGDCRSCDKNYVVIYAVLKNGLKLKYTEDVTSQVESATDPKNIVINLKGISPIIGDSGLHPSVNGWVELNPEIINL